MGKVIKNKIQGMSWQMKVSLVLLLTVVSSVFMYQGYLIPKQAAAANVTRYLISNTGTTISTNEGNTNITSGSSLAGSTTIAPWRSLFGTSAGTVSTNVRITTATAGTWYKFARFYISANYTGATEISGTPTYRFGTRSTSTSDQYRLYLIDFDPAGAAGNGTEITSTAAINSANTGTYTEVAGSFTAISTPYTIPAGHRLVLEVRGKGATGGNTLRFAFGSTSTGYNSNIVVNETAAPAGDTLTADTNTAIATSPQLATATNVLMQRFRVTASANSVEMNSLTINDPGSASTIDSVKVYEDTSSTATLPGTATLIGELTSWNGASTVISLNQGTAADRTVTSGTPKYIYIVYNMNSGMATQTVQSQVTAVGVVSPDTGSTGLTLNSNAITLSAAPSDTLSVSANAALATSPQYDTATGVVMQRMQLNSNANGDGQVILSSVTMDDAGNATSIGNAKVYIASTSSSTLPGTAVLIGNQASWNGSSASISLTQGTTADRTVTTVSKYLYVVYDMATGQAANTVQSHVTAVGVASPDSGATGLNNSSNTITLNAAPVGLSCNGCHGYTSAFVDSVARDGATGNFPGSHNLHVIGSAISCAACHVAPSGSNHANGNIDMANPINGNIGAAYGAKGASFAVTNYTNTTGFASCTSTYCHGTSSPNWGADTATAQCAKCHSDSSAVSSFKTTAGTTDSVNSTIHVSHLNKSHNISTGVITCADCHTVPATAGTAGHYDTGLPAEFKACSTSYCHGSKTPVWTATMLNSTIADCSKCHDLPPTPGAGSHANIPSAITTIAGLSACSSLGTPAVGCHPTINSAPSTYGNIFAAVANHIDGTVQGGSCVGCHNSALPSGAPKRIAASAQLTSQSHHVQGVTLDNVHCAKCHWEANSDGSVNSAYHDQTSGKPVDLVIWGTGNNRPAGTTYTEGTTGTAYTADGTRVQVAKITNHCLGCHSTANDASQPFGDGKTPKQYAWDGKSVSDRYKNTGTTPWGKYNVANTNKKATVTKAFSAHGNAASNAMGWDATNGVDGATIPNRSGAINVECYDCHNSHGSDVTGVTTSYAVTGATNGGLLKNTSNGLGGYTATYQPAAHTATTGELTSYNPGAGICFDCHVNASATATRPWGYSTFGATNKLYGYWDTPYFGNYTFASTRRAITTYKAGTANAKGKNAGGHYGVSSALGHTPGQQINGLCTPCHDPHGVSTTITQANSVPLLKGTWVTSPYKEDLAPTTTEKRGGGSRNAPVNQSLPGYNIDQNTLQANRAATHTVPNTAFGVIGTTGSSLQTLTDTQFAGLCLNCHAKANLTDTAAATSTNWKTKNRIHQSVAGWASTAGGNASNAVHAYTCSKCHVPHNSRLPRLMATNCLNFPHKGRVVSGGTVSATANTTAGQANYTRSVTSGSGAGRFPSGGARYAGTQPTTATSGKGPAYFPGPWGFGVAATGGITTSYGSNCHNSATSGGATFAPAAQQWNTKTPW